MSEHRLFLERLFDHKLIVTFLFLYSLLSSKYFCILNDGRLCFRLSHLMILYQISKIKWQPFYLCCCLVGVRVDLNKFSIIAKSIFLAFFYSLFIFLIFLLLFKYISSFFYLELL